MKKIIFALIFLAFAVSADAEMVNITFAWDPNTEEDLAGYKLYYSETNGGPYTPVDSVGLVTTLTTPVAIEPGETLYFVLTAFDTEDNESGYSNQVAFFLSATGPGVPPRPPGLRIQSWAVVSSR